MMKPKPTMRDATAYTCKHVSTVSHSQTGLWLSPAEWGTLSTMLNTAVSPVLFMVLALGVKGRSQAA